MSDVWNLKHLKKFLISTIITIYYNLDLVLIVLAITPIVIKT